MHRLRSPTRAGLRLLCILLVAACGSDGGTGPAEQPPVITVEGVTDATTYNAPVTFTIRIDRGSYEATLNGQAVTSGRTVSEPGSYILLVTARNGLATSTKQVTFTISAPAGGTLIVRLINLGANEDGGGGDAILVTDSSASGLVHALIDAGAAGANGSDPELVARRLTALGVDTLSFLLLTHAHADHYLGMPAILSRINVRRFYYNGQVRSASTYQSTLSAANTHADSVIIVRDSIPLAFGRSGVQSRFTILPPLATQLNVNTNDGTVLNDGSVGAQLRRGTAEMFFTGDSEVAATNRWRTQFAAYTRNIDVLKVGHHGANNAIFDTGFSGNAAWLDHTNPSFAVISANGVSHPRVNAVRKLLERSNMRTYCTNVHGEITLRIYSDSRIAVSVEKNTNADCEPGANATT